MVAMEGRNVQLVSIKGGEIWILQPRIRMSRDEAINLAAYLVALAAGEDDFIETLAAIEERDGGNARTVMPIAPPEGPDAA